MKANINNIDLCDSARETFCKFGFEKVKDTKQPTYTRFGCRYIPSAANKLKKIGRTEPPEPEIYYQGRYYVLSSAAAKILDTVTSTAINRLRNFNARHINDDDILYWLKSDVYDIKTGRLLKPDPFKFLDNCNDLIFTLTSIGTGQKLISTDGNVKVSISLTLHNSDDEEEINKLISAKPNEVFKHLPRNNVTENHYLIGDGGTVVNLSTSHLLQQWAMNMGYYFVFVNNKETLIHRLIGLLFIANMKNKRELHHIDYDKMNNDIDNLVWVTSKEHKKCHLLLDDIKTAKTKTARTKAERAYRKYIKQVRRDNSQA